MSDIKIFTDNIDGKALDQIHTLAKQQPFAECKIRIMPDVHAGAGCVIGFTANLGEKVIPNIVGVDIGCGMLTVELGKINIDFDFLDKTIRQFIPAGRNVNKNILFDFNIAKLKCYEHLKETEWIKKSIGSLGGGNHFIEIDIDDENNKYLIIHTGSRNLGKQVAEYYQNIAIAKLKNKSKESVRELISAYKSEGRDKEIQSAVEKFRQKEIKVPKELSYLTDNDRLNYLFDMKICQNFAKKNRETIAKTICEKMGWTVKNTFETIHNYIELETLIVRKGAISAKLGERVLIPVNMRDGCIIGIGKGNEDWNCSAPHGAGRIMSRSQAKENVSINEYQKSMKGIYTTSVNNDTIDESPMAYKPIDEIVENIKPAVDIEKIIKPIYNFKASE